MTTTCKRRWLRFSLRTVFVIVTLVACWLGYQLNWIHQRRTIVDGWPKWRVGNRGDAPPPDAPCVLWLFAEPGYQEVIRLVVVNDIVVESQDYKSSSPDELLAELRRTKTLFPEAKVHFVLVPRSKTGKWFND